jgi:hypothetical protein
MVSARSLQDDLMDIPGVEGADVEGSGETPAGLRIRIAEGADQQAVGGAIRRVLTAHGLGTDTHLPGEPSEESVSDDGVDDVAEPAVVEHEDPVAQAHGEEAAGEPAAGEQAEIEKVEVEVEPEPTPSAVAIMEDEVTEVIDLTEDAADELLAAAIDEANAPVALALEPDPPEPNQIEAPRASAPPTDEHPEIGLVARLRSVSVEEGRDGIVVTVTATNDAEVRHAAASTEGGVESAVVRATARLARPEAPDAIVIDIEDRRVEGIDIVMIVLDIDGSMLAGSAVVGAGRAFALGRATWAALSL